MTAKKSISSLWALKAARKNNQLAVILTIVFIMIGHHPASAVEAICNTSEIGGCSSGTFYALPDANGYNQWKCTARPNEPFSAGTALCRVQQSRPSCSSQFECYTGHFNEGPNQYTLLNYCVAHNEDHTGDEIDYDCFGNQTYTTAILSHSTRTTPLPGFMTCGQVCNDADPACGYANGNQYSSPPHSATALCANGTPSAVSPDGPFNWSCTVGSAVTQCSSGLCRPPENGTCNNTVQNRCITGLPDDDAVADDDNFFRWACHGQYGGTDADPTCSVARPANCGTTPDQCLVGTPVPMDDNADSFVWGCQSPSSPNPTVCSVRRPTENGECNNLVRNGCQHGTSQELANDSGEYRWACRGSGPGHTDAMDCHSTIPTTYAWDTGPWIPPICVTPSYRFTCRTGSIDNLLDPASGGFSITWFNCEDHITNKCLVRDSNLGPNFHEENSSVCVVQFPGPTPVYHGQLPDFSTCTAPVYSGPGAYSTDCN